MAVTPFLRLQKPPFDTIPWDQAINGNMDIIDAFVQRYMAVPNYMGGWLNSTNYISGQNVLDVSNAVIYLCLVTHTSSASPTTFAQDRTTFPTYWVATQNVTSGNTSITVGDNPPVGGKSGDFWFDSAGGELYVYYNDGNSLQWVIATNQSGMVGEAPNDGNVYGRQRSQWTPVTPGAVSNVGRNLIHNSMFNIAQRGAGPFATLSTYTLDRWYLGGSTDAASITQFLLGDPHRASIGDEAATYAITNTFTGNAAAGAFHFLQQGIEGVRRLSGKTVTLSFWANCASGALKLGINYLQVFGSGGSTAVWGTGQSVTLSTTLTRYSVTTTIASTTGKTIGTAGDCTNLAIVYSSGATNNALFGNVGVQSGQISLWGVQLEIAQPGQTQPTPLEKPDPQQDWAKCQRFYQSGYVSLGGYTGAGAGCNVMLPWTVLMRAAPAITPSFTTQTNCGSSAMNPNGATHYQVYTVGTATGNYALAGTFTASADF